MGSCRDILDHSLIDEYNQRVRWLGAPGGAPRRRVLSRLLESRSHSCWSVWCVWVSGRVELVLRADQCQLGLVTESYLTPANATLFVRSSVFVCVPVLNSSSALEFLDCFAAFGGSSDRTLLPIVSLRPSSTYAVHEPLFHLPPSHSSE